MTGTWGRAGEARDGVCHPQGMHHVPGPSTPPHPSLHLTVQRATRGYHDDIMYRVITAVGVIWIAEGNLIFAVVVVGDSLGVRGRGG